MTCLLKLLRSKTLYVKKKVLRFDYVPNLKLRIQFNEEFIEPKVRRIEPNIPFE